MDVPRILSTLLMLLLMRSTVLTVKTDRAGSSFPDGPNFARHARRNVLNEYLVPPPPPRNYPIRSGRIANPQPTEAPGYFSKFMEWLNPFRPGSSPPTPAKSPPRVEASFPPAPHGPFLNLPPTQSGPPVHHPVPPQPGPSLYPPINPHRNQHSGLPLSPPFGAQPGPLLNVHPGPLLNAQPGPLLNAQPGPLLNPQPGPFLNAPSSSSVPVVYNALATNLHEFHRAPPSKGPQVAQNKAKVCNACNRVPWVPMQSVTPSHSYLPADNQVHRDAQHSASHEIQVPGFSDRPKEENRQSLVSSVANPLLYQGPVPPLYKAEPFDWLPQSPGAGNAGFFKVTSSITSLGGQEQRIPNDGLKDLTSSGTHVAQGHVSAIPQNHGGEISGPTASVIDSQAPVSRPSDQDYATDPKEHGLAKEQFGNHDFQNGNVYRETFHSNLGSNDNNLSYLPPSLNPSISYGASFPDKDIENTNYHYSDDLSPSSSDAKNSHVTTEAPFVNSPANRDDQVHFEQSPLLDLTIKNEDHAAVQWPPSPTSGLDNENSIDNNVRTTMNYFETDNSFFEDTKTESYSSLGGQAVENGLGVSTQATFADNSEKQQDLSRVPSSGHVPSRLGPLWTSLLDEKVNNQWDNSSKEDEGFEKQDDVVQRQQNVKRNKQVQVIIPYTSEYTPIPFQQSYGDWSVKTNSERTQGRKVPPLSQYNNIDNYVPQESRNEVRLINQLQSDLDINDSKVQPVKPFPRAPENDGKGTGIKANNNSIDVRRLQKNIDNWTIQEYSKPTTSSTILPSSLHPYLLPSKKIPTEYLTTTEPGDHSNESIENGNENVRSYSLAGFSFNEVEHEGSASNRVEVTQRPVSIERLESISKPNDPNDTSSAGLSWQEYPVSISPVNKERVYVVTPQPTTVAPATSFGKLKESKQRDHSLGTSAKLAGNDTRENFTEFEAIEKAYQVLPQAVNNLAVASTGKEDMPLWGIMEHEEFASLNSGESDEDAVEDIVDRPVLYSGHSKVSRAKR